MSRGNALIGSVVMAGILSLFAIVLEPQITNLATENIIIEQVAATAAATPVTKPTPQPQVGFVKASVKSGSSANKSGKCITPTSSGGLVNEKYPCVAGCFYDIFLPNNLTTVEKKVGGGRPEQKIEFYAEVRAVRDQCADGQRPTDQSMDACRVAEKTCTVCHNVSFKDNAWTCFDKPSGSNTNLSEEARKRLTPAELAEAVGEDPELAKLATEGKLDDAAIRAILGTPEGKQAIDAAVQEKQSKLDELKKLVADNPELLASKAEEIGALENHLTNLNKLKEQAVTLQPPPLPERKPGSETPCTANCNTTTNDGNQDGTGNPDNTFGGGNGSGGGGGGGLGDLFGGGGAPMQGQQQPPRPRQVQCKSGYECKGGALYFYQGGAVTVYDQPQQQQGGGGGIFGGIVSIINAARGSGQQQNQQNDQAACPQPQFVTQCTYGCKNSGFLGMGVGNNDPEKQACKPEGTQGSPQAEIKCEPELVDVGSPVLIAYSCKESDKISGEGKGFNPTKDAKDKTITGEDEVVITNHSEGENTVTYGVTCSQGKETDSASCDIQINTPWIILTVLPKQIAPNTDEEVKVGWVTSGMSECRITSPQLPEFDAENAEFTSTSGTAKTPKITGATDFILTCTTLGGKEKESTETVFFGELTS